MTLKDTIGIKHGPTHLELHRLGELADWMEHSQHTIIGEKLIFKFILIV